MKLICKFSRPLLSSFFLVLLDRIIPAADTNKGQFWIFKPFYGLCQCQTVTLMVNHNICVISHVSLGHKNNWMQKNPFWFITYFECIASYSIYPFCCLVSVSLVHASEWIQSHETVFATLKCFTSSNKCKYLTIICSFFK